MGWDVDPEECSLLMIQNYTCQGPLNSHKNVKPINFKGLLYFLQDKWKSTYSIVLKGSVEKSLEFIHYKVYTLWNPKIIKI